jgi:hypothetical protein
MVEQYNCREDELRTAKPAFTRGKPRKPTMQRDMDLTREILLNLAADDELDGMEGKQYGAPESMGISGHSAEEVGYHLRLLIQAGYLTEIGEIETMPVLYGLTWNGHEFLDNIRDETIWRRTKARLKGLPSAALAVVASIAEAEIKKHLGLP